MSKKKISIIIIKLNGTKKEIQINKCKLTDISKKAFFKKINKGKEDFEKYCEWVINDKYKITIWGWKDGKYNQINKFELPDPEDIDLYYGDIIFLKTNLKDNLLSLSLKKFNLFYNNAFGGFETLGSDDSDTESDISAYISDDGFIVNSNIENDLNSESEESSFESDCTTSESECSYVPYDSDESDADERSQFEEAKDTSDYRENESDEDMNDTSDISENESDEDLDDTEGDNDADEDLNTSDNDADEDVNTSDNDADEEMNNTSENSENDEN